MKAVSLFAPEPSLPERRVPEFTDSGYRIVPPLEPEPARRRRFAVASGAALPPRARSWPSSARSLYKLKFVTVAGSMIVSVGAYALLGGWWFGVGLVALIFVHEMGHVLALRRQGCRPRRRSSSRSWAR